MLLRYIGPSWYCVSIRWSACSPRRSLVSCASSNVDTQLTWSGSSLPISLLSPMWCWEFSSVKFFAGTFAVKYEWRRCIGNGRNWPSKFGVPRAAQEAKFEIPLRRSLFPGPIEHYAKCHRRWPSSLEAGPLRATLSELLTYCVSGQLGLLPSATSEIVKALLVTSLTHVCDAITSVQTFTFTFRIFENVGISRTHGRTFDRYYKSSLERWLIKRAVRLWCGSGNAVGDTGARMLSKALLMNKKLATIHWDRNNTSPQGFSDIAAALERSSTLYTLINDTVDSKVPFSWKVLSQTAT